MPQPNNYVIGKGRVYFSRFADGAALPAAPGGLGYRYLGNTPGVALNMSSETLDHFSSESGIRRKDDSIIVEQNFSATLQTDNISSDNLAYWLGGNVRGETQAPSGTINSTIVDAYKTLFYRVGVTAENPEGDTNLATFILTNAGVALVAGTDYVVDLRNGTVEILFGATGLTNGATLVASYTLASIHRHVIVDAGTQVTGSLLFVSDNPKGVNRNVYLPYVRMKANGDLSLIGEEWQSMSFDVEVLQLNSATRRVIVATT